MLGEWRSCHSFPLNTFQMGLRKRATGVYSNAAIVQRLKRVPSVIAKLERFPRMRLSQMQDVGGCRAVVDNVTRVRRLERNLLASQIKHALVAKDDYINSPAPSGYRGVHLVYRYWSDKVPVYNSLQIEIQLRSRLQHAWATAVETVGLFLDQSLKSSSGSSEWLHFFKLVSTAFARVERSRIVTGTPTRKRQLIREIRRWTRHLDVFARLEGYGEALRAIERAGTKRDFYYLLVVDPPASRLDVVAFARSQYEVATREYLAMEKSVAAAGHGDAVLVAAGSVRELRRCYPNYFADTRIFVEELRKFLAS